MTRVAGSLVTNQVRAYDLLGPPVTLRRPDVICGRPRWAA